MNKVERKQETGNLAPKKVKEYKIGKLYKEKLMEYIDTKPDVTLQEVGETFEVSHVAI